MMMDKYQDPRKREDLTVRQVVLIITQSCNLNCRYCYESHKSSRKMTEDVCKKVLLDEFAHAVGNESISRLEIAYLGGEPLLNFDLIKNVSEWLWQQDFKIPYSLELRTNGTLLDDEKKKWFLKNKHRITLTLSLDGLGEMQRINRTAAKIDYLFFTQNWPERRSKLVLFEDSINLLSDTILEMREKHIPFEVDIGFGFPWAKEAVLEYEKQLDILLPYYENDVAEARASALFPFSAEHFFAPVPEQIQLCSHVSNIVSYDVNGRRYSCHMLTPVVLGQEKADWFASHQADIPCLKTDVRCHGCPLFGVCKTCPAMNLKLHNDLNVQANFLTTCAMLKVQARACAKLCCAHTKKLILAGAILNRGEIDSFKNSMRLLKEIPEAKTLNEM